MQATRPGMTGQTMAGAQVAAVLLLPARPFAFPLDAITLSVVRHLALS